MRFRTVRIAAAIMLLGAAATAAAAADYREEFSRTLPLDRNGRFAVRNTNGEVRISTWERSEVEIKAVKIARRRESDLERVRIEVTDAADAVTVDTIYERRRNIRVSVEYDVRVPRGVRLDAVRTVNGDVVLTGEYGDVRAGTTNGGIRLEGSAVAAGLSTTNGSIRAVNVEGPVDAHSTNGSIRIAVRRLTEGIRARTTNGAITLEFAERPDARLEARTTNGRLRLDWPVTMSGVVSSRRRIAGDLGKGGPTIDLRTVNGSITIAK